MPSARAAAPGREAPKLGGGSVKLDPAVFAARFNMGLVHGAEEAAAGKSFRNIRRVHALPVDDVGVAELVRAASLLLSEAALPAIVARAENPKQTAEGA